MHSRNQQLIADAARLVVMAHGGVSGAEQDPTKLFDLLEEGVRFTVVQPEAHRWRPAQVIPTPLHVLGRISPIFSPFSPLFCAFSPSRRGGSNEPKTGTQGQETAGKGTKRGEL